jgi:hypothetical protein
MTTKQAIEVLERGGELPELAEAVGLVCSDPATAFEAILPGLRPGGFVAEQAALALYKRTFRPLPADRNALVTDPDAWRAWLAEHGLGRPQPADGNPSKMLIHLGQAQKSLAEAMECVAGPTERVKKTRTARVRRPGEGGKAARKSAPRSSSRRAR